MTYGLNLNIDPLGQYCMYLRKSRADIEAEAFGKFETLSAHRSALEALAERLGIKISKVYQEIVSGETIAEREQMKALLHDIRDKKWNGVLVYEVERLARGDLQDQATVARTVQFSGTYILTPMKIYDPANEQDMEFIEFGFLKARTEFRTVNRRLAAGRLNFVARGNYIGPYAPYGYDLMEDKRTRTLKPNADAEHVRYIFESYLEGANPAEIAFHLESIGAPSPRRSERWEPHTIRYILRNVVYKGMVAYSKRKTETEMNDSFELVKVQHNNPDYPVFEGLHEAIISEELFERVQAALAVRSVPPAIQRDIAHEFAGLLYCAKCGYAMRCLPLKYVDGTPYSRISHKIRNTCHCKSCKTDVVLDAVIAALKSKIEDYEMTIEDDGSKAIEKHERDAAIIQESIDRIKSRLHFVFDAYECGDYTREEFLTRKAELAASLEDANAKLEAHMAAAPVKVDYEQLATTAHEVLDTITDPSVPGNVKNKALRKIIRRIDYFNSGEKFKGDDISLDIFFIDL